MRKQKPTLCVWCCKGESYGIYGIGFSLSAKRMCGWKSKVLVLLELIMVWRLSVDWAGFVYPICVKDWTACLKIFISLLHKDLSSESLTFRERSKHKMQKCLDRNRNFDFVNLKICNTSNTYNDCDFKQEVK